MNDQCMWECITNHEISRRRECAIELLREVLIQLLPRSCSMTDLFHLIRIWHYISRWLILYRVEVYFQVNKLVGSWKSMAQEHVFFSQLLPVLINKVYNVFCKRSKNNMPRSAVCQYDNNIIRYLFEQLEIYRKHCCCRKNHRKKVGMLENVGLPG